jgi:hypothetical protein
LGLGEVPTSTLLPVWVCRAGIFLARDQLIGGMVMRDIRSDLQERANFIEQQIRAAHSHFEKMVQQLQSERDMRIADLKSGLAIIERLAIMQKLIEFDNSRVGNVVKFANPSAPRLSLADRIKAASG